MGLAVLCVAGCGATNTQKAENPEQTPAYPQASFTCAFVYRGRKTKGRAAG